MNLKTLIRDVPDFPSKGVLFRDISPLLKNHEAMNFVAHKMIEGVDLAKIEYFAGIESRGFILAMLLATTHKKGFMPIRKAGKLPPPVLQTSYDLEYGKATIELPPGSGSIMIVDDVLATGGTLQAAIDLSTQAGYKVEHTAVLINLTFLNQMKFKGKEISSVIQY
jgi:adenine phosphoribosyltransferase